MYRVLLVLLNIVVCYQSYYIIHYYTLHIIGVIIHPVLPVIMYYYVLRIISIIILYIIIYYV